MPDKAKSKQRATLERAYNRAAIENELGADGIPLTLAGHRLLKRAMSLRDKAGRPLVPQKTREAAAYVKAFAPFYLRMAAAIKLRGTEAQAERWAAQMGIPELWNVLRDATPAAPAIRQAQEDHFAETWASMTDEQRERAEAEAARLGHPGLRQDVEGFRAAAETRRAATDPKPSPAEPPPAPKDPHRAALEAKADELGVGEAPPVVEDSGLRAALRIGANKIEGKPLDHGWKPSRRMLEEHDATAKAARERPPSSREVLAAAYDAQSDSGAEAPAPEAADGGGAGGSMRETLSNAYDRMSGQE